MNQDPYTIPDDVDQKIILHLTEDKWAIVLAAESSQAEQHQLADTYFDYKIFTSIRLHDDKDTWMVELSTLAGPCFVAYNKDYAKTPHDNIHMDERTAYIVEPMKKWGNSFLPIPYV